MFDVNKIRKDFPMIVNNPNLIYFDNSATTYKPYCVLNAVKDFYENKTANVHRGDYDNSFIVSSEFDEARNVVAKFLNCDKNEVVFTSGATHSLNQAAQYGFQYLEKGDVILTTLSEHASNILPWFNVSKKTGATIEYIKQDKEGIIDLESFKKQMNSKVKVVTLAHVSNVLGHINPIKEIAKIVRKFDCILVVDGAQSAPHIKVDVKDLDVDMFAFSSHKMCGPDGIGVLYGKSEILNKLEPLIYGGGSNARFTSDGNILLREIPERFEAGTPNIEGVLGLKKAVEYLMDIGMDNIHNHEVKLKDYMISKLKELDNVTLYNPSADTGIIAFNVKGVFSQDSGSYLNNKKICVRSGHHCAKMVPNLINENDTVRASMYLYNTFEEIDRFIEALSNLNIESALDIFF